MGPSWDHRWVLTAEFSVLPFRFADFIICRFSDTSDPTNFWTLINILSSYFFGNEICRSCSIGSAARPVVGQRRRRLRQSRVAAVGRFGVDAVQRAAVDDAGVAPNVAGVEEQRRRRRRHRRRRRAARRGQPQHQPAFGASFFFKFHSFFWNVSIRLRNDHYSYFDVLFWWLFWLIEVDIFV